MVAGTHVIRADIMMRFIPLESPYICLESEDASLATTYY